MEISAATPATATGSAVAPKSTKGVVNSDFETFLKMLTTQMKNQDPLKPIESADFAVQLATFSGVEQQVRSNDLLAQLGTQMSVMGMAQFAGWVGMEALATSPAYFDGSPLTLEPTPDSLADRAVLVVRDSTGALVQRADIPLMAETIAWQGVDGSGSPLPPDIYSFQLESSVGGVVSDLSDVAAYSRITEARNENGETFLMLAGGARVASSAITALRAP